MKKIVITGRNGFIANTLRARFEREDCVVSMLSVRDDAWRQEDFTGVDIVVHTAALVHKKESNYTLDDYRRINTELTLDLAQKAKQEGVGHFIFISTMAVYGVKISCFKSVQVDENTPITPVTKYGVSKWEAEQGLHTLEDESFKVSIIRPPFVYGPNCRGNYGVLRKLTLKLGVIPKLANRKSILFVDNLAEHIYGIACRGLTGVFMPQNEKIVSTWEIAALIAKWNGKKAFLSPIMNPAVQLGSLAVKKFATAFGSEYYDPAMSRACGFSYEAVPFEKSIEITEKNWTD